MMEKINHAMYPCPNCGAEVEYEPSCAGYHGGYRNKEGKWVTTVMVCIPWWECGGADEFHCTNEETCGWWYREPNNRSLTERNVYQKRNIPLGPQPAWFGAWYTEQHKSLEELEPEDYEATGYFCDEEPFDDTQDY